MTKKSPDGKLRLLYEGKHFLFISDFICVDLLYIIAAPMSFLMEQAGGLSLTGKNRIMVRIYCNNCSHSVHLMIINHYMFYQYLLYSIFSLLPILYLRTCDLKMFINVFLLSWVAPTMFWKLRNSMILLWILI